MKSPHLATDDDVTIVSLDYAALYLPGKAPTNRQRQQMGQDVDSNEKCHYCPKVTHEMLLKAILKCGTEQGLCIEAPASEQGGGEPTDQKIAEEEVC